MSINETRMHNSSERNGSGGIYFYNRSDYVEIFNQLAPLRPVLEKYIQPNLHYIGLISNLLVILTMSQKEMAKRKSIIYLLFLALSDFLFIFISEFPNYLMRLKIIDYNFFKFSNVTCFFYDFSSTVFHFFSILITVVVTIDRFYAIYKPLKSNNSYLTKSPKVVSLVVFIVSVCLALPHGFLMVYNAKEKDCDARPFFRRIINIDGTNLTYYQLYFTFTEPVIIWFAPGKLILCLNAYVIYKIIVSQKQRPKYLGFQEVNPKKLSNRNSHGKINRNGSQSKQSIKINDAISKVKLRNASSTYSLASNATGTSDSRSSTSAGTAIRSIATLTKNELSKCKSCLICYRFKVKHDTQRKEYEDEHQENIDDNASMSDSINYITKKHSKQSKVLTCSKLNKTIEIDSKLKNIKVIEDDLNKQQMQQQGQELSLNYCSISTSVKDSRKKSHNSFNRSSDRSIMTTTTLTNASVQPTLIASNIHSCNSTNLNSNSSTNRPTNTILKLTVKCQSKKSKRISVNQISHYVTIIILGFYFILSTIPYGVMLSFQNNVTLKLNYFLEKDEIFRDPLWLRYGFYRQLAAITKVFFISNHCLNFFVYLLFNRVFRLTFIQIIITAFSKLNYFNLKNCFKKSQTKNDNSIVNLNTQKLTLKQQNQSKCDVKKSQTNKMRPLSSIV